MRARRSNRPDKKPSTPEQTDALARRLRAIRVPAYGRGYASAHDVLGALSDDEIAKHLVIPLEMLLALGRLKKEKLHGRKENRRSH